MFFEILLQNPIQYWHNAFSLDWVFEGKETYGSRNTNKTSLKSGTKIFDALGRAYNNMVAKIKYLVSKNSLEKTSNEVPLIFDVYKKIIVDDNGNDIEIFRKEDDKNGLRRDSTAFIDGRWEVMEINSKDKRIKTETSFEIKSIHTYNQQWQLLSRTLINSQKVLTFEQYFWKNNRLIKTIFDGVERKFVYGNSLQHDTIKVIPSDEGLYFHSGYNNSVGKIPNEDDLNYIYFVMSPYSGYRNSYNHFAKQSLMKHLNTNIIYDNMPEPSYDYPKLYEAIDKHTIYYRSNGYMEISPYLVSKCVDNGCDEFYVNYTAETTNESIVLYQSNLVYDNDEQKWKRYCRTQKQINATYIHEIQHVENARARVRWYSNLYMPNSSQLFATIDECNSARNRGESLFGVFWDTWHFKERWHENPDSPTPTGSKLGERCDVAMD